MPRRRTVLIAVAAVGVIVLGTFALRVLPAFTGPALPAGATRLHIATQKPGLVFGCPAALLAPVRISSTDDELLLVTVASGEIVRVVWPGGFAAWRVDGRAVVADPWGSVIGRDGDVLDSLGGGMGADDAFHICPFGIVVAPPANQTAPTDVVVLAVALALGR